MAAIWDSLGHDGGEGDKVKGKFRKALRTREDRNFSRIPAQDLTSKVIISFKGRKRGKRGG